MSDFLALRRFISNDTNDGKTKIITAKVLNTNNPACKQRTLRAGIGTIAAEKKAADIQIEVRRTLIPHRFRTSPTCDI